MQVWENIDVSRNPSIMIVQIVHKKLNKIKSARSNHFISYSNHMGKCHICNKTDVKVFETEVLLSEIGTTVIPICNECKPQP